MKSLITFRRTRVCCCLIAVLTVSLASQVAEAQLSRLNGIQVPGFGSSRSSRGSNSVVPQVIRAVEAAQSLRRSPASSNWNRGPTQVVRPQPVICPTPAPPGPGKPPVAPPPPSVSPSQPQTGLSVVRALVADAKTAFSRGQYERATATLDKVIELVPEDADAFQFRSLTYFAQQDFERAAADAYDAFKLGNAWTWPTMSAMYPKGKTDIYTAQLRKLEDGTKSEQTTMSSHFLLAYHYIVLGHLGHAEKQLNKVLAINADEQLSQRLLVVVQSAQREKQVSQK